MTSVRIRSKTGRARSSAATVEPGVAQQLVGPGQAQVAEQDRGPGAERLRVAVPAAARRAWRANRRCTAGSPRRVSERVHDVVVDERAGLHELQRGDGGDDLVRVAPPAPR